MFDPDEPGSSVLGLAIVRAGNAENARGLGCIEICAEGAGEPSEELTGVVGSLGKIDRLAQCPVDVEAAA